MISSVSIIKCLFEILSIFSDVSVGMRIRHWMDWCVNEYMFYFVPQSFGDGYFFIVSPAIACDEIGWKYFYT